MSAPPGYSVRPATMADVDAIVALCNAYDEWDFGRPDTAPEHLRADWVGSGFELAEDSWLVADDAGVLAGFAYVQGTPSDPANEAWGRVHPEHLGRGIGSFLVAATEDRARARPGREPATIRNYATSTDRSSIALFEARGYRRVRRFWHMERGLTAVPPVQAPPGIAIRPMRPGEERAVHAVIDESFAEHWGHVTPPFDEWRGFMAEPGFDPTLVVVAVDGPDMVGAVISLLTSESAWIDDLGVRRSWRNHGIGSALLHSAFADLAGRGFREVRLNVDAGNETGATRLYERAGMRVRREWLAYEKVLGR